MRIESDLKLDFDDVLIRPKRSTLHSRSDVRLEREFVFRTSRASYCGVPIMASNMDGVGTFEMWRAFHAQGLFVCLRRHYTHAELVSFFSTDPAPQFVAPTIGIGDGVLASFRTLCEAVPDSHRPRFLCIDVANGYTERFINFVKRAREAFPDLTLIAGNVVTGEMTEELILHGVDIVKIGIGQGSVCTTRLQTGVGYPQLSSIVECAEVAHGLGGHIISDGGCVTPGDIAKAFGAGADFVMLGGMLAGHDQGGGEVVSTAAGRHVKFYGMSSSEAMSRYEGGVANYRSSEGRLVGIPYRGDVRATLRDILGGLRSSCTYVGASELKHFSKCTTFIRTNSQYNKVFV